VYNRRGGVSLAIGIFLSLLLFNALNYNINLVQSEIIQNSVTERYEIIGYYQYYDDFHSDIINDSDTWATIENEPEIQSVTPIASTYLYDDEFRKNYNIYGIQESEWNLIIEEKNPRISKGTTNFSIYENNFSHVPVIGYATSPRITNDSITITYFEKNNVTLDIIGWVTFDISDTIFENTLSEWMLNNKDTFVFITLLSNMTEFEYIDFQLKIKLISEIINYQDIPGTINRLNKLVTRLELKYSNYWFYSPVTGQLTFAQLFVYIFLVITLIFLLPFFFLSFYISKLSSDLNLESRRVQYGLFLTRGINAKTIKRSYIAEGVILGIINGIIAFLLTPIFGLFLASYLPVKIPRLPLYELYISFYLENIAQLGWSVLIGVVLGILIMRLPFFYLRLSPHELMHQYREEEAEIVKTRGRRDVAFLVLGLYPIGTVALIYLASILQAPSIFYIIFLFLGSYAIYAAPFSPFLISYGLSSILARQPRILSAIARIYTKPFPDLQGLADRMILSKLYRISRIAFVMSLALTFIIFPLILSASLEAYNNKLSDYNLGGDVRIDVGMNSNLTLEVVKQRPEVAAASLIQFRYEASLTIIHMNTTDYVSSVDIASFWKISEKELLSLTESKILVSIPVIKDLGLDIGDTLSINKTDYVIAGTFKALGGTDITIGGIHAVIINQQLDPKVEEGRFIIRMNQLSNESLGNLYEYIKKTDPEAKFKAKIDINSSETQEESFDILVFLVRILETQAVLLSFVAIFALAFLMIIRVRERSREFGTWRSKGMSNKQLIQGLIVETASIGTLGLVIGIVTGSALVIVFQSFILNLIIEGTSVVPLDLIIPLGMWVLLLWMIIGTIILSIIIGLWATLTPISKQIRYEDYT
jgi:ABC-type lipoprotein release transport system permease subunit